MNWDNDSDNDYDCMHKFYAYKLYRNLRYYTYCIIGIITVLCLGSSKLFERCMILSEFERIYLNVLCHFWLNQEYV